MTPPRPDPQYTVNVIRKFDEDTEPIQYFGDLFITNALLDTLSHVITAEDLERAWLDVAPDGQILGGGYGSTVGFRFPESYGKFPASIIFANPH
jgi:hypothetical protein